MATLPFPRSVHDLDPRYIITVAIEGVASEVSRVLWEAKQLSSDLEVVSIENGLPATVIVDIPRRGPAYNYAVTRLGRGNPHVQCAFRLGKSFIRDEGPVIRERGLSQLSLSV